MSDQNLQDPAVRKKVRDAMGEISAAFTRAEAEKDLVKEIVKKLFDEHQIPKVTLNKMARAYHRQNFSQQVEDQNEFESAYELILGSSI